MALRRHNSHSTRRRSRGPVYTSRRPGCSSASGAAPLHPSYRRQCRLRSRRRIVRRGRSACSPLRTRITRVAGRQARWRNSAFAEAGAGVAANLIRILILIPSLTSRPPPSSCIQYMSVSTSSHQTRDDEDRSTLQSHLILMTTPTQCQPASNTVRRIHPALQVLESCEHPSHHLPSCLDTRELAIRWLQHTE